MGTNRRTMLKRTAAAVLCAAFLLPMALPSAVYAGNVQAGAQTGADKTLARIQLSVGDGQETPVFRAGEKAKLRISVKNTGNTDAQNVRIAPVIKSEADWPFELDQLNYDQDLGAVQAGEKADAVWGGGDVPLTVKESVTGKAYKLTFRITYDDGEKAYEAEKYVFVKTEAKPGSAEENPSGGAASGDSQGSGKPSGDVQVPGGQTSGGQGAEGQTAGAGWNGPAAAPEAGSVYNSEPAVVGGGSSAGTSVPRVIVTGFSTEPGEVRAGSNFKLIVHLKNTSSRTGVSNLLFDLQAPSSGTEAAAEAPAFLPASGSSSIYLDSIPAGGTKDISIELNARADLVQKPYSISMSMKYEDSAAAQYEAQSSLAIPVTQEARFEFSDIQIMPDTAEIGEEANITCSIYNLGRVKMYNVKVGFEGDAIEGQELFLGNLESGATGMVDGIVTALAESYEENNCRLVLSYEDDAGNVTETKQEFTMTVTQPADDMVMEDDFPVMDEEEPGGHTGLIIALIAGIVLAGGTAAVVIIRRRKKKSDRKEEEWFDEVERSAEDESGEP